MSCTAACTTPNTLCAPQCGTPTAKGPSPPGPPGAPAAPRMRCQVNATALLPTATICDDANEMACKQIFNATAPTGMVRDPKCDLDRLPVSCQDQKFLCKDPGWRPLLSQNCPQTCGLCAADGGTGCRDMQTGCSRFKAFCQDTRFVTQLRPICAKTCGFCTPGQAGAATGDMATECAGNRELCNNPTYSDIMTRYCCGTCNRCTGTAAGTGGTGGSTNPNCQDTKTE
ncbi:Protein E04D5.4 a [Aphelenchoides avenae]|nr:Protein E04D5.4 a [Aphelenchus avenae]